MNNSVYKCVFQIIFLLPSPFLLGWRSTTICTATTSEFFNVEACPRCNGLSSPGWSSSEVLWQGDADFASLDKIHDILHRGVHKTPPQSTTRAIWMLLRTSKMWLGGSPPVHEQGFWCSYLIRYAELKLENVWDNPVLAWDVILENRQAHPALDQSLVMVQCHDRSLPCSTSLHFQELSPRIPRC